jgi:hypothetical protein
VHEDKGTRLERKSWDSKTNVEDSQGNIKVDQRQVLKMWENYITKLYNRANWPENISVKPEEEANADKKDPYILHSEVGKAV